MLGSGNISLLNCPDRSSGHNCTKRHDKTGIVMGFASSIVASERYAKLGPCTDPSRYSSPDSNSRMLMPENLVEDFGKEDLSFGIGRKSEGLRCDELLTG